MVPKYESSLHLMYTLKYGNSLILIPVNPNAINFLENFGWVDLVGKDSMLETLEKLHLSQTTNTFLVNTWAVLQGKLSTLLSAGFYRIDLDLSIFLWLFHVFVMLT